MRFCGNCGSRLTETLNSQASPLDSTLEPIENVGVLMGSDLKERFRQAGLESAGQRRNVTVLFADLCDYTGLAGNIDDEALYEVIQLLIRMLAEKVYQYEGMVDKITGDGLMALFGAPLAYENPAERAVRTAMDMQAGLQELNQDLENRLGERLQMRIGLNRGSVIVGGIGADLLIDYTAIGDTVNLARRLQESASVDSILVSESVYQATEALFDYQLQPGLVLKGYQRNQNGYHLLGSKSRPGLVRGIQGLRSPMVGREAELEDLVGALNDLDQYQRGQFVALIGEAGIGKSRLTTEFKANIDPIKMTVLEGQSLTYRKSVSYWIFLELLRDYLGVTPGTSNIEVRERLVSRVSQTLGKEAGEILPFLEHLLSLESSDGKVAQRLSYLDAEQLRKQTFIAVRNLFLAEARQKPLILILEDLHWVDEVSLDLLAFILDSIDDLPVMVLVISRPPFESAFEQIFTHTQSRLGERCRSIQLDNLSDEQSDRLLYSLLGMLEIPEDFHTQILNRAAGVPFYIEEILRMLIDKQVLVSEGGRWIFSSDEDMELEVPDNLQDLILTRFDRLEPVQRSILQTASVIGRQFNSDLLNEVMQYGKDKQLKRALASLVEKAFILPLEEQGDDGYLFRHVLTSDAVYRTLLRRERNKLHGIVAETLEQFYADRLESQVEVLAGHYLRSVHLDKALHYHILAGSKSARDYANLQAKKYYEEARDLLSQVAHSAEQALEIWTGLGDVLVFIGEYGNARECYQEALETNLDSQDSPESQPQIVIHRKIAITYERQGDFDQALDHLNLASKALKSAEILSPVAKAQILNDTGWIYFLRGNFDEAQDALQSALDLVEESDQFSVVASIHNRLGAVAYQLREYKQAAKFVRKSLELRKTLGDLSGEARLYNNLGLLGLMSGDLLEAETNFNQSIQLLEKVGDTEGIALANINLGLVKFDQGDYESASEHLETAIAVADKIGHRFYLGLADMYLGRLETALGEFEHAVDLLDESVQIFTELGAQDNLIDAMCYQAENYLAWGEVGSSIQWSEKARQGLTGTLAEDSVQAGRVLRLRGAIARRQGELEQAKLLLLESAQIFGAAYEKLESARTAFELGLLAQDLKDSDSAQEYFNEARVIFTEVGAEKELSRLKTAMIQIAV
jgi:predicted ATPase/class 3 adenylate cyclase